MAQLALAQFHSAQEENAVTCFMPTQWYSIVRERMSQALKDATKTMTVDQVLQAEQIAARRLDDKGKTPSVQTNGEARRRRSMKREEPREMSVS